MQRRKRVDPRVIGSFVVGAIILTVAGLLFFGPGGFFTETRNYVIFFDGSVKGLNIGSPVRFRGVKIGQVKQINVHVRTSDFKFYIPVVIEIEPSRITAAGSKKSILETLKTSIQGDDLMLPLIPKGLRARMQLDSLVTGQLYVNLDMLPDEPLILTGYEHAYPELPALKSSLGELTKALENLPIKEMVDKLIRSAEGIEKLANSTELHHALSQFDQTTTGLNKLVFNLNKELLPLTAMLRENLQQSLATINAAKKTVDHLDVKIDPLAEKFTQAAEAVRIASDKTSAAMEQVKGLSGDDSQLMEQLSTTLKEVNRTARAARNFMTELERDPQMLLRGRGDGENK